MQAREPFRDTDDQDVSSWLTGLEELFEAATEKNRGNIRILPSPI